MVTCSILWTADKKTKQVTVALVDLEKSKITFKIAKFDVKKKVI